LIAKLRTPYSSVCMRHEATLKLNKSSNDWLKSDKAVIEHLCEKNLISVFLNFARYSESVFMKAC